MQMEMHDGLTRHGSVVLHEFDTGRLERFFHCGSDLLRQRQHFCCKFLRQFKEIYGIEGEIEKIY